MVRKLLCFFLVFSTWALKAESHSGNDLGIGFILGAPTALSAKKILSDKHAIDFGLGYSWGNSIQGFSDYLFTFKNAWSNEDIKLTPYLGVGASLTLILAGKKRSLSDNTESNFITAARFPLGISWMAPKSNLEIFAEIVPMVDVIPGLYAEFGAGIGFRIYI